ncbi:hypothetical protein Pla110_09660 [Polystyrenella longa]|uniref:Uncharacterized protein n=1 Tax=Polystyrenella longa TaxID=2528007 RepID=A0A518CJ77_9PLAN|nr:hypothetical protein [Polystyrenella longa]QDU79260.1 hypothetical protein Pla110_09660 [Polystyrenella longa]
MSEVDFDNCQRLVEAFLNAVNAANTRSVSEIHSNKIREALLLIGSHTEDNINASLQIEYGPYLNKDHPDSESSGCTWYDIKLKNSGIALVDILYELENMNIPDGIQQVYPQLTQNEWEASMRVSLLVLSMCGAIVSNSNEE